MPKIYISPSSQSENVYATGNTNEAAQCKKIASACATFLKKYGFIVKTGDNTKTDMYKRVQESNEFKPDIHLAIHTNASVKHNITGGSQVYLFDLTGERKKVGTAVFKRLSAVTPGKSAEKIVQNREFYEIVEANAITVYCECEFHDTKEGSDFIIKNTKQIGEAIALGICDYYKVDVKPDTESVNKTLYTVQAGAFNSRKNAEAYVTELKKAGFDGFIIKK